MAFALAGPAVLPWAICVILCTELINAEDDASELIQLSGASDELEGGDSWRWQTVDDEICSKLEAETEARTEEEATRLPFEQPELFEAKWQERFQEVGSRPIVPDQAVDKIRLVLGVMSTDGDGAFRQTMRRTWMQHPNVCLLTASDTWKGKECRVFVAFVLGTDHRKRNDPRPATTIDDPEELKRDGVHLPIFENMNMGKSLVWFQHAVKAYPWATHIGKMDQDVFPIFSALLPRIANATASDSGCEPYLGEPILINNQSTYGKLRRAGEVPTYWAMKSCLFSMNGGIYVTSYALMKRISEPGNFWSAHPDWGGEDTLLGAVIAEHVRTTGACVVTWPGRIRGAWEHWKAWTPPSQVDKGQGPQAHCERDGMYQIKPSALQQDFPYEPKSHSHTPLNISVWQKQYFPNAPRDVVVRSLRAMWCLRERSTD